ncbi:MAG: hypothetical protein JO187_09190 [Acidobacteria bacterium]|nr:hypothetical protein [Acidobacteriota bacterium]
MSKLVWTIFILICLAAVPKVGTAQNDRPVPPADSAHGAHGTARKPHVITNEDLTPPDAESSTSDPKSEAKADAHAADKTAQDKKKGPSAAGPDGLPQYSVEELRQQQSFLIEQIASLRKQIAEGPVDSRRDILAHVLEYRSAELETVRRQIDEAEQRQRSTGSKDKAAKSDKTVSAASGTNAQSEAQHTQP